MLASVVLLAFVGVPCVVAQVTTASVNGVVQDLSGANIAGAKVELTNEASAAKRETVSNKQGAFAFSAVPSGDYTVVITAAGFETYVQSGVHLDPQDQRVLRNLKLAVGSETVTVTVAASDQGINTDSGEMSDLISSEDIDHLSVEGRDVTELLKILPGFAPNSGISNSVYDPSQVGISGAVGQYAGNGTPLNGVSLLSDGADITDPGNFGASIQTVNYAQVAEVKVQTASMTADTAHGPIVINAVGRAGGNKYHGSLYAYARVAQLNSIDWFTKYTGQIKPNDRQIYPGFTLGGPVLIPGTSFNHQRKLTFFAGAEQYAQRNVYAYGNASSATLTALVPTAAMRTGDFSSAQLAAMLGTHYTSSGVCDSVYVNICSVPVTAPDGTAIVNGQMQGLLDPGAVALFNVLPLPNSPTGSNNYNYVTTNLINNDLWQARGRLDYALGARTKIFALYSTQRGKNGIPQAPSYSPRSNSGGVNTPGGGLLNDVNSELGSFNVSTIISASLTNEFFGAGSYLNQNFVLKNFTGTDRATLNYPYNGLYANGSTIIPQLADYGYDGLPIGLFPDPGRSGIFNRKWIRTLGDNVTTLYRTHTIRVGFYGQLDSNNEVPTYGNTNGQLSASYFGETQPVGAFSLHNTGPVGSGKGGNYLANFAEGHISNFTQNNIAPAANLYFWNIDGYVQDHWRALSGLSIDFGVRFEHLTPWGDAHGLGIPIFRDSAYYADSAGSPLPGFLWHAIDPSVPNQGLPTRWAFVEPRAGLAWDPYKRGETVFRAGFGMYRAHDSFNDATAGVGTVQGVRTQTLQTTTLATVSAQNFPINSGSVASLASTNVYGYSETDDQMPLITTWNAAVVQKLPYKTQMQIAYVGNKSTHLIDNGGNQTINLANINALPVGAAYSTGKYSYANYNAVAGLQAAQVDAFRKYPIYYGVILPRHRLYANYNALQVELTRQSGRVRYGINYTFSKALGVLGSTGNGQPSNPFNLRDNYQPETFDRSQVFNASYTFILGNPVHQRLLGLAANGWEISGITNFLSGPNLTSVGRPNFSVQGTVVGTSNSLPLSSIAFLGTPDVLLQPRLLCDPTTAGGSHRYINGACFGLPTQLGTNGTYRFPYIHGPAFFNSDLTLRKSFALRDKQSVQVRFAAFNFLNRANTSFTSGFPNQTILDFSNANAGANPAATNVLSSLTSQHPEFGSAPLKVGRRVVGISLTYQF
jgi:hypothetical protein